VTLRVTLWVDGRKKPVVTYSTYVCAAIDDITFSPEPVSRLEAGTNSALVSWGEALKGPVPLPVEATNLTMVSAGLTHMSGVGVGGKVFTWGDIVAVTTLPPAGLSNVVSTSAGYETTYALTDDGRVFVWPAHQ